MMSPGSPIHRFIKILVFFGCLKTSISPRFIPPRFGMRLYSKASIGNVCIFSKSEVASMNGMSLG